MSHGDSQAALPEHSPYEARHDSVPTDQVEPNAPSAPQWSLSEDRVEGRAVGRDAAPERVSPQESYAPSKVSEAAVETAEPETDEPREARKGWWQRRFKI
jgi:hypothetical protein